MCDAMQKIRPGQLIDFIKEKGFTTIKTAAGELNVSEEGILELIKLLRNKKHLVKIDLTEDSDCESGSCSGCSGCGASYVIQVDDEQIAYALSSIASR